MKKLLFLVGGLLSSWAINAQSLENQVVSYSDAALLFSNSELNGTARFNAMGGAFGALGGDLSAMSINPAGTAVFKNTEFGITLGVRAKDVGTTYYNNSVLNENTNGRLTQGGGVLVFNGRHSNWSKFAIGFNYSLDNDFNNEWLIEGNSNPAITPLSNFYDPDVEYPNANKQLFTNRTNGKNNKYTLSFASELDNKLYIGAAMTTRNIEFAQFAQAEELNSDNDGNVFDVVATQELLITGSGVSFSAGVIFKPIQELRLGAVIESPTWYSLTESLDKNRHDIFLTDDPNSEPNETYFKDLSELKYNMTTPGRLTGSFAYIFGKQGLISFDYTYKDYGSIRVRPNNEFNGENQDLENSLQSTSEYRIGGEYRFENISLRGGYFFAESPFTTTPNNSIKRTYGDTSGYSLGLGFKFGKHSRLDLAYQNSERSDLFKTQDVTDVTPTNLDVTNNKFTATFTFGF